VASILEAEPSPRLVPRLGMWLLWLSVRVVLVIVWLTRSVFDQHNARFQGVRLAIESGGRGWQLIEYEEIHRSACEYLGSERVHRVVVEDRRQYSRCMRTFVRQVRPTHYFYDPRTGSQQPIRGL